MTDVWQQGDKLFCRAVFQGTRYWQSKSKQAWVILHFDQAHLPLKQQQKNTFVHFPVPNYDKHFFNNLKKSHLQYYLVYQSLILAKLVLSDLGD